MRVLVVEDSDRLRESLAIGLRDSGFAVDTAADGLEGLRLAGGEHHDVIVLDIMLPGMDGFKLLDTLRRKHVETHVLILTARDAVEDRVRGLQAGADDYLVKPFSFDELLARVQALVRRTYGRKTATYTVGGVTIDLISRNACKAGRRLDLTAREFSVLECLLLQRGQTVSRAQIEAHIYDRNVEIMSNVVDAAIYSLRRKIDLPDAKNSFICTRRGMGYEIEPEGAQ